MTDMSIEQTMQNSYRGVRERLGRPFVPKPVLVPRSRVQALLAPPTPQVSEELPETRQARAVRDKVRAMAREKNAKSPAVLWSTEAAQVSVTPKLDWNADDCDSEIRVINGKWREIMREVCEKHGVGMLDVRSPYRGSKVTAARHEIFYRLRTETALSFPEIGRRVGGFDHSTVYHGMNRHIRRIKDGEGK